MIPMRNKTIFKSRWWALLWAAGILWGAHDFVSMSKVEDAANTASDNTAAGANADASTSQLSALVGQIK